MIEIEADFGTTVRGGMIRAYRADGPEDLEVGDMVRAVDIDEDLSYVGTVYAIEGPFVYLLMYWHQPRRPIVVPGFTSFSYGSARGPSHPDDAQTMVLATPLSQLVAAV